MRVLPCRLPSRAALSSRLLSLFAGFVCALALSNTALPPAFGQAPSAAAGVQKTPLPAVAAAAPTAAATTPEAAPAKGAHEGIKVSGYWKIDVRNPDGTLDKHVEFENSLYPGPANETLSLVSLLMGGVSSLGTSLYVSGGPTTSQTGGIYIPVGAPGGVEAFMLEQGPCGTYAGVSSQGTACILSTVTDPVYNNCLYFAAKKTGQYTADACLANLAMSHAYFKLTLSGSFTAGSPTPMTKVATSVDLCPTATPTTCTFPSPAGSAPVTGPTINVLTAYALPNAVPVAAGQVVNVSVTLSFQ